MVSLVDIELLGGLSVPSNHKASHCSHHLKSIHVNLYVEICILFDN